MSGRLNGLRLTLPTQLVLRALLDDPAQEMYGLEISAAAGLVSGTIHPILARLEGGGIVVSRWEDIDQHVEGRPRRRYYRLSPDGMEQARAALADAERRLAAQQRRLKGAVPGGFTGPVGVS